MPIMSTLVTKHFQKVDCIFYGMYGDCGYKYEACHDSNHVCIYSERPVSPFCARRAVMGEKLKPVGSIEGVWKYAHPHDVGIFLDGTWGWYLRHDDELDADINVMKRAMSGKPANIYRPTKDGQAIIVPRRGYDRGKK